MNPTRKVVCAACYYSGSGVILVGPRHFDETMGAQSAVFFGISENEFLGICESVEQGFIDQYGVFMNRTEALQVAIMSGQLNGYTGNGLTGELHTDNLY